MSDIVQNFLLLDIPIFGIAILFYFYPPAKINPLMGYKTARSMKNEENWKFAQNYSSKRMIYVIPAMLLCQIPYLFGIKSEWLVHCSFISSMIVAVYTIYSTERALINLEKEKNN